VLGFCFLSGVGSAQLELGTAPFLARHSAAGERPYLFGVSTALSPLAGLLATLGIKGGAMAWGENIDTYRHLMVAAGGRDRALDSRVPRDARAGARAGAAGADRASTGRPRRGSSSPRR
jgi:hypothetical protein